MLWVQYSSGWGSSFVVDYLRHLGVIEFKRKKRMEEKARESREAKEKAYEGSPRADLCEDVNMLKKLRVPELNKFLTHVGIKEHLISSKGEKIKVIVRQCLQQTAVSEHDDNRSESSEENESDHNSVNEERDSDASGTKGEDGLDDVILAFIVADVEDVDERPVATRSGRAITRRAEIDFSFF